MITARPRLLYGAAFAWLAVTGGRFLAPFLEHEALFSDTLVGSVLAAQTAVYSLFGSLGGSWADSSERINPHRGRAQIMFVGVALGSASFLMHGCNLVFPSATLFSSTSWHFFLRIAWACSLSLVMPVLDGITLAHLDNTPGMHQSDFGKERLFGAISWAIVNLLIGPITDRFGFISFYPIAVVVTFTFFASITIYVKGQEESGRDLVAQDDAPDADTVDDESTCKDHHTTELSPSKVSIQTLLMILAGSVYGASFLFAVVCLSSGMAVVESLVFLFFEFLGGSNTMCSITVALTVLFEIPIFHVAPKLLQQLGSGWLLLVAACSYIVRVVGYSLVPKGHIAFVLLLEPLHGVTFACAQTATVDFAAHVMPKGSEASGQGLMGLFKGLGSVIGLILGGILEEKLGPRIMYRIFAITVAVGMVVLSAASCRRRSVTTRHDVIPQSETELSCVARKDTIDMEADSNSNEAVVELT